MKPVKRSLAIAAFAVRSCANAHAQEWLTKPVTIVVPFSAGGPLDVLARILQPYVSETLAGRRSRISPLGASTTCAPYLSNLIPAVKKGSAKAVATLAATRVAAFPEVATADVCPESKLLEHRS